MDPLTYDDLDLAEELDDFDDMEEFEEDDDELVDFYLQRFSGSSIHEDDFGDDDDDDDDDFGDEDDDDFGAILALPWLGRKNRYARATKSYVRRRKKAHQARLKGKERRHSRMRNRAQRSFKRMERMWSRMKPQAKAAFQSPETVRQKVNQWLGTGESSSSSAGRRAPPLRARQAAQIQQAAAQTNYARRRGGGGFRPGMGPRGGAGQRGDGLRRQQMMQRRQQMMQRRQQMPVTGQFAYGQEQKFHQAATQVAKDHTVATAATVLGIFAAGVLLSDPIMGAVDRIRY